MRQGCTVHAVCPLGHPLRYVTGVETICTLRELAPGASLRAAIRRSAADLIVPCDDRIVMLLHELHAADAPLRPLIEHSLGDPQGFVVLNSRAKLMDIARRLGIRTAPSTAVTSVAQLRACLARFGPVAVLKQDVTCGGEGVHVVRSDAEGAAALRRMRRMNSLGAALKRLCVNGDPLALSFWRWRDRTSVSMQSFIKGTPANIMVASWRGQVVGEVGVRVVSSQGLTGAALVVQLMENGECSRAAQLLASRLGINGFFGLDFILQEGSGAAHLIELNPRCTQLGHLPLRQGDLAGALCAAVRGTVPNVRGKPIASDTIAFFPQARLWGVSNTLPEGAYHDVPSDQPSLIDELLREPWPDRRWLARAYHLVRRRPPLQPLHLPLAGLEKQP